MLVKRIRNTIFHVCTRNNTISEEVTEAMAYRSEECRIYVQEQTTHDSSFLSVINSQ